ncbi:MAG TPA: hypothetical protein HA224_04290 [Nanoarchaeota archaeon]|nr:hypothetical protein [Nanoarchaeota archaeon]
MGEILSAIGDFLKEEMRKSRERAHRREEAQKQFDQIRREAKAAELGRVQAHDEYADQKRRERGVWEDPLGIKRTSMGREFWFGHDPFMPKKKRRK